MTGEERFERLCDQMLIFGLVICCILQMELDEID